MFFVWFSSEIIIIAETVTSKVVPFLFWAILRLAGITSLGGAAYALLCRFFYKKLKAPRSVQADRICSPEI